MSKTQSANTKNYERIEIRLKPFGKKPISLNVCDNIKIEKLSQYIVENII